MKKVLIVQTAFLGDVILATPVAENLRVLFPEIEIHFLVKKGNESLLKNHENISKIWVFDKSNGKYKNIFSLSSSFRKEKFDVIFNLHRFGSSGLISVLSGGKQVVGFSKNPFSRLFNIRVKHSIGNGQHEVDRNLSLLKALNLTSTLRRPSLFPSLEDFERIKEYTGLSYFCLAPASVWKTKQLPKEKWIDLAIQLAPKGNIILLGSPADEKLCHEILTAAKIKGVNLAGQLSLLQSAALMKSAKRNFVNDSGPLHLASAVNAPVTAFFCSTIPAFGFGPLSDDAEIRETNEKLDCRPCGLHGYSLCPKGHFKCGSISLKGL